MAMLNPGLRKHSLDDEMNSSHLMQQHRPSDRSISFVRKDVTMSSSIQSTAPVPFPRRTIHPSASNRLEDGQFVDPLSSMSASFIPSLPQSSINPDVLEHFPKYQEHADSSHVKNVPPHVNKKAEKSSSLSSQAVHHSTCLSDKSSSIESLKYVEPSTDESSSAANMNKSSNLWDVSYPSTGLSTSEHPQLPGSMLAARHGTLRRSDVIRVGHHAPQSDLPTTGLDSMDHHTNQTHPKSVSSSSHDAGRSTSVRSTKIAQLIQTLQNQSLLHHQSRGIAEDEVEESNLGEGNADNQNVIKPVGERMSPVKMPDPPNTPKINFHAALSTWAEKMPKSVFLTFYPLKSGESQKLTYGKLYKRALSLAYTLTYKLSSLSRGQVKNLTPGEHVGICIPILDPPSYALAIFACLLAKLTAVPVEVPFAGMDTFTAQMGNHLKLSKVRVILTNSHFLRSQSRYIAQASQSEPPFSPYPSWPVGLHWLPVDDKRHTSHTKFSREVSEEFLSSIQAPENNTPALIEYSYGRDGVLRGAVIPQSSLLSHCRLLSHVGNLTAGDVCVCVVEHRRELGLWHAILTSAFCGAHSILISRNRNKQEPNLWLRMASQYEAKLALVTSNDLQSSLETLSQEVHSLRLHRLQRIIVCDAVDPWSIHAMDAFHRVLMSGGAEVGFVSDCLCPTAYTSEASTVCLRYMSANVQIAPHHSPSLHLDIHNALTPTRYSLRLSSLQHNVVDGTTINGALAASVSAAHTFPVQDCGSCMPSTSMAVVSADGSPQLCRSDEIGEIVLHASHSAVAYFENAPDTLNTFLVKPIQANGQSSKECYVRSGLLGFVSPSPSGPLLFICGSLRHRLCTAFGTYHAADIIHRILRDCGDNPLHRQRCVLFTVPLLQSHRVVLLGELKSDVKDSDARLWCERVLQMLGGIYQMTLLAFVLVAVDQLPRIPYVGIDIAESRKLFVNGSLLPRVLWLSPVVCCKHSLPPAGNLISPECFPERRRPRGLTDSSSNSPLQRLGQVMTASRPAEAVGPPWPLSEDGVALGHEQDKNILDILLWRAWYTPDEKLFCLPNAKAQEGTVVSCLQLLKKSDRIAGYLLDKLKIQLHSVVVLIMPAGVEMLYGLYGTMLAGGIPLLHKAPNALNVMDALPTCLSILRASMAVAAICTSAVMKLLKSKEVQSAFPLKNWPCQVCVLEDMLSANYKRRFSRRGSHFSTATVSPDHPASAVVVDGQTLYVPQLAYLDYSVTNDGTLSQVSMSHKAVSMLCKAVKFQCEFYPTREVALCLDPFTGVGLILWCLSPIYCGHKATLIPLDELNTLPQLWLSVCSQRKIRDVFCTYPAVEVAVKVFTSDEQLFRGISLDTLRSLVVIGEERPRVTLLNNFTNLFSRLGMRSDCIVCGFGTRVNVCLSLQKITSLSRNELFLDRVALRHNRLRFVDSDALRYVNILEPGWLLPSMRVIVMDLISMVQCSECQIGEVCVASEFNTQPHVISMEGLDSSNRPGSLGSRHSLGNITNGDGLPEPWSQFRPTGFMGFIRRMERVVGTANEYHDAVFILGRVIDLLVVRGLYYFPADIELTVNNSHTRIVESAAFMMGSELVICVEVDHSRVEECASVVYPITARLMEEHALIPDIVLAVSPGAIPINPRAEKQRWLLRDLFSRGQLPQVYAIRNH